MTDSERIHSQSGRTPLAPKKLNSIHNGMHNTTGGRGPQKQVNKKKQIIVNGKKRHGDKENLAYYALLI